MKKVFTKISAIILNILLTLVSIMLILTIYNLFQTSILKKDYTNFFGYTIFKVVSGSMAETINVGDIIIVDLAENDVEYKKDDIVVFKQDNGIITHRIIEIDGDRIVTKGDANNSEDKPITRENIIGQVTKVIRNVEVWKNVLTAPEVLISGITTIILFGIAFSYDGSKKENKKTNLEDKKEE